jgi:TolA protein
MFATLFCYRCRTFQAETSMRRVSTKSGARWRCLKCLEESGWKPPDNRLQNLLQENAEARRALLAAALLRDAHWAKRKKKFPRRALLLSLLLHAALISLQLADQDFGLHWSRTSTPLETAQGAILRAVLRTPTAAVEVRASNKETLPPAPKSLGSTARPPKEKPVARALQKKAAILATNASSSWRIPVQHVASKTAEESASDPDQADQPLEKSAEQPPVAKNDDVDQAELAAAIAQANQAAAERQQNEDRLRSEVERKLAEKIRAEIEAEKIKAEAAAQRDRQEALARNEAKQAAEVKVNQEARDKQRAAELEQSRQAASIAKNLAQNPAEKSGERGPSPAVKALEQATSPPPAPPSLAPDGPKRKALILGTDPKNISLAFYGEGWRQKIERIGAANYPKLYKDRYYGPLVATVTINSDGTLAGVHIDQSSGEPEVDEAVKRIVEMSAPFAAFPPDLKRGYDQIDITRTWVFEHPSKTKQ